MMGIEFANGRSSLGSIYKKQYESSSKLYTDKYLKNEPSKINPQQLEKSIQNEIKKAKDLLHRINHDIQKHSRNGDNSALGQLREMQESIRRKNIVIKEIQNQINYLKNVGMKSKNRIDNLVVNLSEEIRCNSAAVVQLKKDLDEKRKLVSLRRQEVDIVFQRYSAKFKSQGREVIDFNKFKEIQQKKRRDFQKNDKVKATSKKQMSSIWEDRRQEVISNDDRNQNKIKDTMNHRNVAEAALKTERKRHRQQMNNCLSKLEFLKGEQEILEQKIRKRELELKQAEERFSDSRTKHEPRIERRFKHMKIKTMH